MGNVGDGSVAHVPVLDGSTLVARCHSCHEGWPCKPWVYDMVERWQLSPGVDWLWWWQCTVFQWANNLLDSSHRVLYNQAHSVGYDGGYVIGVDQSHVFALYIAMHELSVVRPRYKNGEWQQASKG
jgi:hypothetical protein